MVKRRITEQEAIALGKELVDPLKTPDGKLLDPGLLATLPSDRTPGEDGVPYEWYRMLWAVLGSLLIDTR